MSEVKKKEFWLAVTAAIVSQTVVAESDVAGAAEAVKLYPAEALQVLGQSPAQLNPAPLSDGGELLRSVNGVSGSRMGGRGIDPIIRGQSQGRLNILLDGAYLHSGCPNRMDPPTTYAVTDSYDQITVIKGSRTVIYGGGGSGGTVLFQRGWPDIEQTVSGEASYSYRSNSDSEALNLDLTAASELGYLRVIGHRGEAENYQDGAGNEVRSAWESQSAGLLGGIRLGDNTRLEGSFEQVEEENVLFAGAGMDSPFSDNDSMRLKLTHDFAAGNLQRLRVEAYRTEINHLMDNFSLRPAGMMQMKAPTSSDTSGGRVLLDAYFADTAWVFGADLQQNDRNGTVINNINGMKGGILWPEAEIRQYGLFTEAEHRLDNTNSIKAGLRLDRVSAEAGRSRESFMLMGTPTTPAARYQAIYGASDQPQDETNVAGFASWSHRLNSHYQLETSLSRSVRSADATERFMAKGDWVGNPQLAPEKHHQLELSLDFDNGDHRWQLSSWYNRVSDYILREYRGNVQSYRNVDAELYGIEFEGRYRLSDSLSLRPALAWLQGNNRDDNQSLSQISPLSARLALEYQQSDWLLAAELVTAARQNDVCLRSDSACNGLDVQKTPGYGVMNLHGEYRINDSLMLTAGVDNLFDKLWRSHENREDVSGNQVQVAEPGRSAWLKLSATF